MSIKQSTIKAMLNECLWNYPVYYYFECEREREWACFNMKARVFRHRENFH